MNSMSGLHFSALNLDSSNKTNMMEQDLNELSEENPPLPSTIEIKNYTTGNYTTYSKINTFLSDINETKIPYPNKNEIPIIKIKNENYFESGNKIKFYKSFDDSKFSKCKNCKKSYNKYYCEVCKENICRVCRDKKHKYHIFKDLDHEEEEIEKIKSLIRELIFQYFSELKKNENNDTDEIIKKEVKFELDENEMNNIEEPLKEDTNDISLIKIILKKYYKNYFHYENIKECYKYIKKKYNVNNKEKNDSQIRQLSGEEFITIIYKNNPNIKMLKIFGSEFVKNNKDICIIIYKNEKYTIDEYFKLDYFYSDKNLEVEIKIIGVDNIINSSHMFKGCSSLKSLPDISKWNTNQVENMNSMFYGCSSLKSLPDISKWNTNKVKDMNSIFYGCSSLESLPDISKWNTNQVEYLNPPAIRTPCLSGF